MYWLASRIQPEFELFLGQAGRQDDLLGDNRRLRHGHHHLRCVCRFLHQSADGLGDFVELLDLPSVIQPVRKARRETLEHVIAAGGLVQLDELGSTS